HIINLDKTLELWERARKYVRDISSQGGNILFVGTKQQSQKIVREEADRCGAFHVTNRWLGGMLSNFETIKRSIERMRKLEDILAESEREGTKIRISKKERLGISRELERLSAHLGGI